MICEAVTTKTAIKNFIDALKEKCALGADVALQRFYALKRNSDSFATKVNDLLSIAVPGLTAVQKTTILKAKICLGVPEHVKAMIQFNSSMDWKSLLEALKKCFPIIEGNSSAYGSYPKTLIKQEPTDSDIHFTETSMRGTGSRYRTNDFKRPFSGSGQIRFPGKCFYCGNLGHRIADCRIKRDADSISN